MAPGTDGNEQHLNAQTEVTRSHQQQAQGCPPAALPLSVLAGVGPVLQAQLNKLGLYTVQDLLFHLPLRYQDRSRCTPIAELRPGAPAVVVGEVVDSEVVVGGRRPALTVRVHDTTGRLTARFFHFNTAIKNRFRLGSPIKVYGEVRRGPQGFEMIHPEYTLLDLAGDGLTSAGGITEALIPIYPTTKGLRQTTWHKLIEQALNVLKQDGKAELLPVGLVGPLMTLSQALQTLHRPSTDIALTVLEQGKHPAQRRLALEELLAHHLSRLAARSVIQSHCAQPFSSSAPLKQRLLASLPFQLTTAQLRVVAEIETDLVKEVPMMRLIQGDVGCGKTLVAALAALRIINHGKQVVMMAPTELLAEQHAEKFHGWLAPLGITIGCLTGSLTGKKRRAALMALASGEIMLATGTHALFQNDVQFKALGLVIVDEQHRFGVQQRLALWEKGLQQRYYPHQLVMTATPIPRTLAMTTYADLDSSMIDELPPGRQPITTLIVPDSRRHEVIQRVAWACTQEDRQIYWICTLVEHSPLLAAQAAEQTATTLGIYLPGVKIGLVHGRMKASEKQATLQAFKACQLQLLVATTVIEVGVDVPNASFMVIENPERLGLAQLHQLRGRVGRGSVASYCLLLYKSPLSQLARKRLAVLKESQDGFIISQRDLEIRGPGELLGTRQTGDTRFKVADLLRDHDLIPKAQQLARQLQQHYPEQIEALIERWLPDCTRYTNV